jgi:hypothetical protein
LPSIFCDNYSHPSFFNNGILREEYWHHGIHSNFAISAVPPGRILGRGRFCSNRKISFNPLILILLINFKS